jgi:nucleoid DNA-binding protein
MEMAKDTKNVKENKEVKGAITTEDIIKIVAGKVEGASQKDVREILNGVKDACADALKEGRKVQLTGFFTAQPIYRSARTANDISTKKPMDVPESVGVSIKAGSLLKSATVGLTPADYKKEVKAKDATPTDAQPVAEATAAN